MWWGGFSEYEEIEELGEILDVLIPMWWGGFSEFDFKLSYDSIDVLIPMWWGGFSESGETFFLLNSAG